MNPETPSSPAATDTPWTSPYRWVMLALLWLLYSSFGFITRALYPLVTPILADLNMSYSQMGLVMGSWQLAYIGALDPALPAARRGVLEEQLRAYCRIDSWAMIALARFLEGRPVPAAP